MSKEPAGERVIKKIGSSHVIWFPESDRWVEFQEPAWYIYSRHESGRDEADITGQLVKRYGLPIDEALRFYREIIAGIELSAKGNGSMAGSPSGETTVNSSTAGSPSGQAPFSTRGYIANGRHFSLSYGSPLLEYYIHRPFAHLESGHYAVDSLSISLSEEKTSAGTYCHLQAGEPGSAGFRHYRYDDTGFLKHRLYTLISSYIYGIPEEGWMAFIHASAVTDGKHAVLFSSASGSGKSTMAALLQVPGEELPQGGRLFFMSDDFVPVDAVSRMAFPFPAALTVKEGSFGAVEPCYDRDNDADKGYGRAAGSKVRYLLPAFPENDPFAPRPVKKIFFLKHQPGAEMKLERLDTVSALSAFHEEARVSQNPVHARAFIDWFVTVDCYRLEYSDNVRAVRTIHELTDQT